MSEEKGLEGDLEDGDGIERVASEGFGEVRQRAVGGTACGGLGAIEFWRRADGGQCGPNGGLCFLESLPNSIGRRIAHAAIEISESLAFVVRRGGLVKKCPELLGTEEESFDFVRNPHAEGASTSGGSISVATEDPSCADGFLAKVVLVVSA